MANDNLVRQYEGGTLETGADGKKAIRQRVSCAFVGQSDLSGAALLVPDKNIRYVLDDTFTVKAVGDARQFFVPGKTYIVTIAEE